jgi:hypothetical protein
MPLTEEDLTQLKTTFGEMLGEAKKDWLNEANGGITKRLTAAEKASAEAQKKMLGDALTEFKAQFTPASTPDKGTPASNDQFTLQLKTLESKLNETNAKYEEAEKRARAATEKNRQETKRRQASEALAKIGIKDPVRNGLATSYLIDSKRAIDWDSEDEATAQLVFRDERGDAVQLEQGLRQWAKTAEEAKHLLDATGARGSGSQPGGNGGRALTPQELAAKAVFDNLGKG